MATSFETFRVSGKTRDISSRAKNVCTLFSIPKGSVTATCNFLLRFIPSSLLTAQFSLSFLLLIFDNATFALFLLLGVKTFQRVADTLFWVHSKFLLICDNSCSSSSCMPSLILPSLSSSSLSLSSLSSLASPSLASPSLDWPSLAWPSLA